MIFKSPPDNFKKELDVVVCYIEHCGYFVLLHRNTNKKFGDKFGLPAGKVDDKESPAEAMQREIFEETGIKVKEEDLKYFNTLYVRGGGSDFVYHMFSLSLDQRPEIKLSPSEHKGFLWVTPEESLGLDLIHDLDECTRLFYKI